jgi:hypothetical protein
MFESKQDKGRYLRLQLSLLQTLKEFQSVFPGTIPLMGNHIKDVLGRQQGLIRKDWIMDLTQKQALDYAINDLRSHYENHIEVFLSH